MGDAFLDSEVADSDTCVVWMAVNYGVGGVVVESVFRKYSFFLICVCIFVHCAVGRELDGNGYVMLVM